MRLLERNDTRVRQIPVVHISPSQSQPRTAFSQPELQELAESIRQNGILQPLTVRKASQNYELIAGERRLRASVLAGYTTVPCIVVDCDDRQAAVFSLLENLQRVDLDPFEEAEGIQRLLEEWNITQDEAAQRLGKKQSTIANKLRLLKLTPQERLKITGAGLTERHARALLKLKNEEARGLALKQIIEKKLNVQQTEELIDKIIAHCMEQDKKTHRKTIVIKDVRIFMNTINKAVDIMRQSGIEALTAQNETEEYIECVVRIPKSCAFAKRPA